MFADAFASNPFNILPHLASLLVAYILAVPIGWNREQEERSAGLRTFPLVAVATCGFIQAVETPLAAHPEGMARVMEGLITGMGFIGGGAILRQQDSVKGTATAASLWVTGAIGAAVGLGSYDVAIVLTLVTIATLWIMAPLKRLGHLEKKEQGEVDAKRSKRPRKQVVEQDD
jgi:putative Mg2+ transporter-C (MgtC) family protein